jgi:hypothetical protein
MILDSFTLHLYEFHLAAAFLYDGRWLGTRAANRPRLQLQVSSKE